MNFPYYIFKIIILKFIFSFLVFANLNIKTRDVICFHYLYPKKNNNKKSLNTL